MPVSDREGQQGAELWVAAPVVYYSVIQFLSFSVSPGGIARRERQLNLTQCVTPTRVAHQIVDDGEVCRSNTSSQGRSEQWLRQVRTDRSDPLRSLVPDEERDD